MFRLGFLQQLLKTLALLMRAAADMLETAAQRPLVSSANQVAMDALVDRFPNAPDHWLRMIAERAPRLAETLTEETLAPDRNRRPPMPLRLAGPRRSTALSPAQTTPPPPPPSMEGTTFESLNPAVRSDRDDAESNAATLGVSVLPPRHQDTESARVKPPVGKPARATTGKADRPWLTIEVRHERQPMAVRQSASFPDPSGPQTPAPPVSHQSRARPGMMFSAPTHAPTPAEASFAASGTNPSPETEWLEGPSSKPPMDWRENAPPRLADPPVWTTTSNPLGATVERPTFLSRPPAARDPDAWATPLQTPRIRSHDTFSGRPSRTERASFTDNHEHRWPSLPGHDADSELVASPPMDVARHKAEQEHGTWSA